MSMRTSGGERRAFTTLLRRDAGDSFLKRGRDLMARCQDAVPLPVRAWPAKNPLSLFRRAL